MHSRRSDRRWWEVPGRTGACLAVLALLYLLVTVTSLRDKSVTVDEFGHLPVGFNVLRSGDLGYCELNPPLMNVLSALPAAWIDPTPSTSPAPMQIEPSHRFWENGYAFMFAYQREYVRLFHAARLMTVALVGALGVFLFLWARALVPERPDTAGLIVAALVWFSPEMLAHARLVTTDAGAACFITVAVWSLWSFLSRPTRGRAVGSGLALGVAQLIKFTAIWLVPVALVLVAWQVVRHPERLRRTGLGVVIALAVALLTIHTGYLFQGSLRSLGTYEFESAALGSLQRALPDALPVPLPADYVLAFDRQAADVSEGDASYLLGQAYRGGRPDYFPVLLFFKTPLPVFGLFALAVVFGLRRGAIRADESALLWLPALLLFVILSFFSEKQLGLRMLLPAAPLVWLWCAVTLARLSTDRRLLLASAVLLLWLGIDVARIHPHYLTYFNAFAGGPSQGWRIALDSNYDWGQDLPALRRWMDDEGHDSIQLLYFGRVDPGLYDIDYRADPSTLQPGLVAVSTSLYGRWYRLYDHGRLWTFGPLDPEKLGRPVARVGNTIHVYDLDNRESAPAGDR